MDGVSPGMAKRCSSPAPAETTPAEIEAGLLAILVAADGAAAGSPSLAAYRSALRRKEEALAAAGGPDAMRAALDRATAAVPERAQQRAAA